MTLPSNGGGTEFNPANNNTRYKVRLPNRLVLKEQDWEVALVSLSFPIRDHHKHHILSNFPRGKVVTMGIIKAEEAAWPSGQGAGLEIWRSRVQVPL